MNQVLIFKQFRTLQIYWFYFTGSNWFLRINEFWWAIVENMEKWKWNKRTSLSPQGSFSLSLLLITLAISGTLFISCFPLTFCLFFFQASGFSWTKSEGKSWAENVAEEFKSGLRSNGRGIHSISWPNSLSSVDIQKLRRGRFISLLYPWDGGLAQPKLTGGLCGRGSQELLQSPVYCEMHIMLSCPKTLPLQLSSVCQSLRNINLAISWWLGTEYHVAIYSLIIHPTKQNDWWPAI